MLLELADPWRAAVPAGSNGHPATPDARPRVELAATDLPLAEMASLDFVAWDRCSGEPGDLAVYGWVERPDGRSDFVVLLVAAGGVGFATSSAEHSARIQRRLGGATSMTEHQPCRPVEELLDALPPASRPQNVVHRSVEDRP